MLFLETQREERLYLPPPCPPSPVTYNPPSPCPITCASAAGLPRGSPAPPACGLPTCCPPAGQAVLWFLVPGSSPYGLWEGEAVRLPMGRLSSQGYSPLLFQYLMWILRKSTCIQQHLGISVHGSEIWSSRMCTTANPSP